MESAILITSTAEFNGMRKAFLLFVLGAAINPAAASTLDASIQESCAADYEPVISLSSGGEAYSHPAPPGFYRNEVCVRGMTEARIASSCTKNVGFYISSNASDNAHFSEFSTYRFPVCTSNVVTQIRDSCKDDQTPLFSVSGNTNAHVASPGFFDTQVCGFYAAPQNITLSMEFNLTSSDTVYADDQEVLEERSYRLAEYPYIVSEGGGAVSGIVSSSMVRLERGLGSRNRLVMENREGSFIVPFTEGGHDTIEDDQEKVLDETFMDQLEPSFSYFVPEQPLLRSVLASSVNVTSDLSIQEGTHTLEIIKTGENTVRILER